MENNENFWLVEYYDKSSFGNKKIGVFELWGAVYFREREINDDKII